MTFQNLKNWETIKKCAESSETDKKEKCNTYLLKYLRYFKDNGNVIYKRDDMSCKLSVGADVTGSTVADYSQTSIIYRDSQ